MINYLADAISVRGERDAVVRRDALNACVSTRRFTKRRVVDFKRDGAMRCR
jgi:hypothetical protein